MAVFRETPTCNFCGKEIAIAKYKDYSDYPSFAIPIGDNFLCWEYKKHTCKGLEEMSKEIANKW